MSKREQLESKIQENFDKIEELKKQNRELKKESFLLCDEKQWFTEDNEEVVVSKRPKKIETMLIGKIHWKEPFKDESTGDSIEVERSQVVRVNKEWIVIK